MALWDSQAVVAAATWLCLCERIPHEEAKEETLLFFLSPLYVAAILTKRAPVHVWAVWKSILAFVGFSVNVEIA